MLKEILGALEFAAFLAALGGMCIWMSHLPVVQRLKEKLFPEVSNDDQT